MRALLAAMVILVGIGAAAHADGPISKQCIANADSAQTKMLPEEIMKQLSGCKSGDLMLASAVNFDVSLFPDGEGLFQQSIAAALCDYHSTILATKDGPMAFISCIKR